MVHPRPLPPAPVSREPAPALARLDWFTAPDSLPATEWHRSGRVAILLVLLTPLLYLAIGFLGPSIVTLDLGPRNGSLLPPWNIDGPSALRNEWVVTAATGLAIILGAGGMWIGLRALAAGWLPRLRRCFFLGVAICALTITVPPLTSADVLMYSAYGRIAVLGMSPYAITPGGLFRTQYDPILRWTEGPWQDTPSVYGPILNWIQIGANRLGGDTVHDVVFWLQLVCMSFMIIACTLTIGLARGDRQLQARVIWLSILNPVMVWAVVVSAHNEAIAVAFGIASFYFLRRHPFIAGLLIGIGCSVKATLGLYGIAMVWAYRRDLPAMARAIIGAGIPSSIAYFILEPEALSQAARNSGYLSEASWLFGIHALMGTFMEAESASVMVSVLGWVGMIVIAWALSRALPHRRLLGLSGDADPRRDPLSIAIRTAVVLTVAWMITAPYSLPWYDLAAWLPLALYGATRLDLILLVRGLALNLAFNPGRTVGQSELMEEVIRRIRQAGSTTVMMLIVVWVLLWWYWTGRRNGTLTGSRVEDATPARLPLVTAAPSTVGPAPPRQES
ncbi:polyprenol phosphomannose-dependent alpha 1,6 mannosyltransferase MptB [Naumannella halotolerans]|uniref:polyprenol phosphomannose-dependent alpha 1,6 mannosyltransferase MptB n=1 Tax=Naumannella halotolerans TaxID=993414 RepID=UPI00370DB7E8